MNILVSIPMDEREKAVLEAAAPDAEYVYALAKNVSAQHVAAAEKIFGNIPPSMLQYAKKLKLLQLSSAGTDRYMPVLTKDCALTNATGAFGLAISEHMLAMLMCLQKRMHQYRDNQHMRDWRDMGAVRCIAGATVVTLGLGDIGGEFARKVKLLGAYTIGVRRTDTNKPHYIDELVLTDELDSVLPRADVLAMALPGTANTINILSRERIALLKPNCVVLNVGRGSAIDQQALAEAIESKGILAGLDVTVPEPLPQDSPLWGLDNCLITPHVSGFFHLAATKERMIAIAADNIGRHISNKPYINLVDPSTGYRADKYSGARFD